MLDLALTWRRAVILLVAACLSGGCSWFNDDEGIFVNQTDDYISVEEPPPLVVPEDLNSVRVQDAFPVPEIVEQPRPQMFPGRAPRPTAIFANDTREDVRIQRLGDRSWLVVPEPPSVVWPQVKQFLADNGVAIDAELPYLGFLDSQWLEVEDIAYRDVIRERLKNQKMAEGELAGVDRFRIKLEQGLRDRTSEIHVRHQSAQSQPESDRVGFSPARTASDLVTAEQEFLAELGAYVAARVAEQSVSMVAQGISTQTKAIMTRDGQGNPALRLNLDFDRAWATVATALGNAGVEILNQDRNSQRYDASIAQSLITGEEASWYCRFLPCASEGERTVSIALAEDTTAETAEVSNTAASGLDDAYLVSVLDASGDAVDMDYATEVLVLLRDFSG
ncbi:MAG: outer membrane protein assembly factor BamC [Pseudomonadaceae bacterium]|nr:outer membrane protein assembly factor BamC [Pseudomonadaceae bacterium]